jgi:hypothetical protein
MPKQPSNVDTTEVKSTVQVLDEGTVELPSGREVATTTAVWEETGEPRGAHTAVFAEGEPRAADQ